MGWRLDRSDNDLELDFLEENLDENIHLFNCLHKNEGILYTIASKLS